MMRTNSAGPPLARMMSCNQSKQVLCSGLRYRKERCSQKKKSRTAEKYRMTKNKSWEKVMRPRNADFGPWLKLKPRSFQGLCPLDPCRGLGLWTPSVRDFAASQSKSNLVKNFYVLVYAPRHQIFFSLSRLCYCFQWIGWVINWLCYKLDGWRSDYWQSGFGRYQIFSVWFYGLIISWLRIMYNKIPLDFVTRSIPLNETFRQYYRPLVSNFWNPIPSY